MLVGENERFIAALISFKVDLDMAKGGLPSLNLDPLAVKYFKDTLGLDLKTSEEACSN